jgi:hypothetical protein
MQNRLAQLIASIMGTCLLAGCSGDGTGILGSSLTTSSVNPPPPVAQVQAPKLDPACVALTARIDALRKEGVTERAEKASIGKSANVSVKRASLAQLAELDKANAEFQTRCGPAGLRPMQAQVAPVSTNPQQAVVTARAPGPQGGVVPPIVNQTTGKQ